MLKRSLVSLVAALALGGGLAAPAAASDASVLRAWASEDTRLDRTGTALARGLESWERSDFRRPQAALRNLARFDRLVRRVRARVRRERASSTLGRSARRAVLKSLDTNISADRALRGLIRAVGAGRAGAARIQARRFTRLSTAGERETAKAVRLFERIFGEPESGGGSGGGGTTPPPQPTQPPPGGGGSSPPSGGGTTPPPSGGGGDGGGGDGGGGSEPPSEQPPPEGQQPPGPTLPGLPALP